MVRQKKTISNTFSQNNILALSLTHMMNSLGWQTTDATPPTIIQGLITVWPPVTEVPPSSAASRNPRIISGITRSRSCVIHMIQSQIEPWRETSGHPKETDKYICKIHKSMRC